MIAINGTLDIRVEYSQAAADAQAWATVNQCSPESTIGYQQGDVSCAAYNLCVQGATTQFCTVDGGGHSWPGAIDLLALDPEEFYWAGETTQDIDASTEIWKFFSEHPRPALDSCRKTTQTKACDRFNSNDHYCHSDRLTYVLGTHA